MNINCFSKIPNDQLFLILEKIDLRDLLNCEQVCKELEERITKIFEHNRQKIQDAFQKDISGIKILLDGKEKFFFNSDCVIKFMTVFNHKFSDKIIPIITKNEMQNFENKEALTHLCFTEENLFFIEKYQFTSIFAKKFAEEYANATDKDLLYDNLNIFIQSMMTPQTLSYFIALEENIFDALFSGFVEKMTSSLKTDFQKDPSMIEAYKKDLEAFDPVYILEHPDLKHLKSIDQELQMIEKDKPDGQSLSKPHITLEDRVRTKVYDAIVKLIQNLEENSAR